MIRPIAYSAKKVVRGSPDLPDDHRDRVCVGVCVCVCGVSKFV